MATCSRCGHYAYYRVDGSKRCVSCNFEDYPQPVQGIDYETASPDMKRAIDAYRALGNSNVKKSFMPQNHPKFQPFFEIADYSFIGKLKRKIRKLI